MSIQKIRVLCFFIDYVFLFIFTKNRWNYIVNYHKLYVILYKIFNILNFNKRAISKILFH